MSDQTEAKLAAHQLDKEPVAIMECSITEFYWIVALTVPITIAASLAVSFSTVGVAPVINRFAFIVGFTVGLVASVFTCWCAIWVLSQIKRDKPYGYVQHWAKQTTLAKKLGLCPFIQPGQILIKMRER